MNNRWFFILLAVAVVGLLVGSWGMAQRLMYGLNPVAFGSYVPWGLWVAFYLFFLGLSAGAFLVTTMAYVFEMKRFESIGPLAAFTVLVALLCEVLFITLDLGRMTRIYQFLLSPSFSSLMTWMFILFNGMLIIYALKTFFLVREDLIRWSNDTDRKGSKIYRFWLWVEAVTMKPTMSGITAVCICYPSSVCRWGCCSTAPTELFLQF
jgi:Ni/Fe-hydrogenase subunit HybB-like protein